MEDDIQLFEVASCAHAGDVNALRFIVSQNTHAILSASSEGSVNLFRLSDIRRQNDDQRLKKTVRGLVEFVVMTYKIWIILLANVAMGKHL